MQYLLYYLTHCELQRVLHSQDIMVLGQGQDFASGRDISILHSKLKLYGMIAFPCLKECFTSVHRSEDTTFRNLNHVPLPNVRTAIAITHLNHVPLSYVQRWP